MPVFIYLGSGPFAVGNDRKVDRLPVVGRPVLAVVSLHADRRIELRVSRGAGIGGGSDNFEGANRPVTNQFDAGFALTKGLRIVAGLYRPVDPHIIW